MIEKRSVGTFSWLVHVEVFERVTHTRRSTVYLTIIALIYLSEEVLFWTDLGRVHALS